MRSLSQRIAKYLETGTGDIQTLVSVPATNLNPVFNNTFTTFLQANNWTSSHGDTSATPGNGTINFSAGKFAFTAGTATVTISNNLIGASNSSWMCFWAIGTNDATAIPKNFVISTGQIVFNLTANCTGTTVGNFWLLFGA